MRYGRPTVLARLIPSARLPRISQARLRFIPSGDSARPRSPPITAPVPWAMLPMRIAPISVATMQTKNQITNSFTMSSRITPRKFG